MILKYTGEEGTFISSTAATERTRLFHVKKKKEGKEPDSYVEAQFFGKEKLMKLLNKKECVGLRFYFGASGEKSLDDSLVVVAVNADGKDLTSTRIGLKDMPVNEEEALVDGPTCPHDCNP